VKGATLREEPLALPSFALLRGSCGGVLVLANDARARLGSGTESSRLSKFPVLAAMPKRFCKDCETSELFCLCSIGLYFRLHGRYSGCLCAG
jgi:hypothetical protein